MNIVQIFRADRKKWVYRKLFGENLNWVWNSLSVIVCTRDWWPSVWKSGGLVWVGKMCVVKLRIGLGFESDSTYFGSDMKFVFNPRNCSYTTLRVTSAQEMSNLRLEAGEKCVQGHRIDQNNLYLRLIGFCLLTAECIFASCVYSSSKS